MNNFKCNLLVMIKISIFAVENNMLSYVKKYYLSLITICIIVYLSFFTPPKTKLDNINNVDKLVHLLMYGGFCFVLWFEYLKSHLHQNKIRLFWGAIVAPIAFSGSIELLQTYCTTNRGGDWLDFLMNTLGVILAALFSWYVTLPLLTRRRNKNR